MANVLPRERQFTVLHLLLENNSIRSVERLTGVHRDTIMRLMVRFGRRCRDFLDERLRNLALTHIQTDECWTFVAKKQRRLTVEEKQEVSDEGDIYLWTCLDEPTKLVATFALGKRSADNARRVMMDLASRLVMPKPHESDAHAYQRPEHRKVIQISTDGFAGYPEAVDLAFGPYVRYGVLIKEFRSNDMPGRYNPPEMIVAERRAIRGIMPDEVYSICTSHVERHNLTIRTFMRRFTRLTLGFSKKLENLAAAVAMFMAYYNFCWRPRFPDHSGKCGRRRVTPAMAAGITDRLWTVQDLFGEVMR
jgi:IS1 family transposase